MNISNVLNLNIMKCYKVLFTKEGIKKNIGALFAIPIIAIHISCAIAFYIKGFDGIKKKVKKIIDIKFNKNNKGKEIPEVKNKNNKKKKKNGKKRYNIKNGIKTQEIGKKENMGNNNRLKALHNKAENKKKLSKIKHNNMSPRKAGANRTLAHPKIDEIKKAEPPKRKQNKEKRSKLKVNNTPFLKTNGEDIKNISSSITRAIFIKNKNLNLENKKKPHIQEKSKAKNPKSNLINKLMDLTDYELNILNYTDALYIDKRTYAQYYLSLIKIKHIIIFTFFSYNDYNSPIIKLSFFFFSLVLFFTTNTLFFNGSTIHRIREDGGSFNLEYQIPQIIYSSLISSVINLLVKALCLTEKNLIEIKNLISKKDIKKQSEDVLTFIFKKLICYFVLTLGLIILFWYYLSCFCAVYKNTQLHLVKDTSISYGLSMMYPFAISLAPGIFRIPALRAQKGNKEMLYNFSKLLQII